MVALFAPWVGRIADSWGRRPLLVVCFGALALRGILFAVVTDPYLIVAIQALDGFSAAVLGVVLPLVVADITRGTGRFNLGLGIVGSAVGIGAAFSTTLGGYAMDHFGRSLAFSSLPTIAACGLALLWLLPETRRVVGALASAVQTAPWLEAKGKRGSANWDARADPAGSIQPDPAIATTRLNFLRPRQSRAHGWGPIICHGCR